MSTGYGLSFSPISPETTEERLEAILSRLVGVGAPNVRRLPRPRVRGAIDLFEDLLRGVVEGRRPEIEEVIPPQVPAVPEPEPGPEPGPGPTPEPEPGPETPALPSDEGGTAPPSSEPGEPGSAYEGWEGSWDFGEGSETPKTSDTLGPLPPSKGEWWGSGGVPGGTETPERGDFGGEPGFAELPDELFRSLLELYL